MDITLTPAKKCISEIEAISSKSYVHRLLIAAALSAQASTIKTNILSEDMKATIDCLNAMGADIKVENKIIYVNNSPWRDMESYPSVLLARYASV